ncbi:hypothetical protein [Calothrix sp. PCC 7507]|nr:hypothetical protein [Calothrix sp. PCC 7507]
MEAIAILTESDRFLIWHQFTGARREKIFGLTHTNANNVYDTLIVVKGS